MEPFIATRGEIAARLRVIANELERFEPEMLVLIQLNVAILDRRTPAFIKNVNDGIANIAKPPTQLGEENPPA